MREKERSNEQIRNERHIKILTYGLIIYMTSLVFFCQWLVFQTKEEFGVALLIGTCGTLVGCFAALLASPFNSSEQERFSKVGSIISTLITGYVLAKLIDPLTALLTSDSTLPLILRPKNGASVLIAIIGFLSGFLLAYQYRVHVSGNLRENENSTDPAKTNNQQNDASQSKSETSDNKAQATNGEKRPVISDVNPPQLKSP